MKISLQAIAFSLVVLATSLGLAQGQNEGPQKITEPMTEHEFVALKQSVAQQEHNTCLSALLETKTAAHTSKVQDEWRKYIAVESNITDWIKLAANCRAGDAYIEIALDKTGVPAFRLRDVTYTNLFGDYFNVSVYSPYMDAQAFNKWLTEARKVAAVKETVVGSVVTKEYFQKITMTVDGGQEVTIASVEDRLAERVQECQKYAKDNEQSECEDSSYSSDINWVYNNFVSYSTAEGVEDAKYGFGETKILSVGKTQATALSDIREIFSEKELLASLKQDWILRNSNQWTRFAKAQTWEQFWNFTNEEYYGPISKFQSYSNKIKPAQIPLVMACADKAGKDTSTNAGYLCVKQIKSTPTIYMYNYYMSQTALKSYFRVAKMDEKAVYVQIPLGADSTGTAVLQIGLNKKASDTLKVFRSDY